MARRLLLAASMRDSKRWQKASGLFAVFSFSAACSGAESSEHDGAAEHSEELGVLEQPLCENKGGTNAVMTAIAVAAGREIRRWKPETDFAWNNGTGRLELTSTGRARCPGGVCANVQAMLDMQKPEAHGKVMFPGNIALDSTLLRSKLKTAWNDQMACNATSTCRNVPAHDLRYAYVEDGSCDKKYFFDPLREGSTSRLSATSAATLANKLKFVGYPSNKMLNFYVRDGQVSVDPTYGLNEGGTTRAGSCDIAATKFSRTDVSGTCCRKPSGSTGTYARSPFSSSVYLCR